MPIGENMIVDYGEEIRELQEKVESLKDYL
jgi:hypothetical protein